MPDQLRPFKRLAVADAPIQLGSGTRWVRMINLVAGSANAVLTVNDNDAAVTTDPVAEVKALANESSPLHFDSAGGGLELKVGCYLTLTGAGAVAYLY